MKTIKDINPKHNLYLIRSYGPEGKVIIKLGYSSNIISRFKSYFSHNPLTDIIDTYFRPDAKEFETDFHTQNRDKVIFGAEWYPETMLKVIENEVNEDFGTDVDYLIELLNDLCDDNLEAHRLGKQVPHNLSRSNLDLLYDYRRPYGGTGYSYRSEFVPGYHYQYAYGLTMEIATEEEFNYCAKIGLLEHPEIYK